MSTKYFEWGGKVPGLINPGEKYIDGNPVEFQFSNMPRLAVQGWHNIGEELRAAILVRLTAAGWIDAGQSKPD